MSELTISDIRARAVIAPLRRPIRTASGAIDGSPLLLLDVLTEQGVTGSAYLFAYTPLMLKPLCALLEQLAPLLRSQPVVRLLGGEPKAVRAYDSWGLVDPARDAAALEH